MRSRSLAYTKIQIYLTYFAAFLAGISLLIGEVVEGFQILGVALIIGAFGYAWAEFKRPIQNK